MSYQPLLSQVNYVSRIDSTLSLLPTTMITTTTTTTTVDINDAKRV